MPLARGLDQEKTDRFIGMYVNDFTLDYGPIGRKRHSRVSWPGRPGRLDPGEAGTAVRRVGRAAPKTEPQWTRHALTLKQGKANYQGARIDTSEIVLQFNALVSVREFARFGLNRPRTRLLRVTSERRR